MKPTLGIVVAMKSEARALIGRQFCRYDNKNKICHLHLKDDSFLLVAHAGVGAENALRAALHLVSIGVDALASVGLAGGLNSEMEAGHIVIATNILQTDGKRTQGSWNVHAAGIAPAWDCLRAEGIPVSCGTILTSPEAVLNSDRKKWLFRQTRAIAVDMESAAVARIALEKDISFFGMRAICDPVNVTLPVEIYMCLNKDGTINFRSLFSNMVTRPSILKDLLRMGKNYSIAKSALKKAWQVQIKNQLPHKLASGQKGF